MENYLKKSIAAMYGLTPSVVESRNHKGELIRRREYVICRQLYYYFALKYNDENKSLRTIGMTYGQDHATVLHARRTINNLIDTDTSFREIVKELDYIIKQHYESGNKAVFERDLVSCDSVSIYVQDDCIYLPKMIYKVEAKHLIKILENISR